MRYCDDMYWSLKGATSLWLLMGAPREAIMQGEQLRRRFYAHGCCGQPSIRTQKHIARHVMCVKGLEDHRGGMGCLESSDDIATLWDMGGRFCRTHSATRKDMTRVHYHRDGVFDSLGKGTACEGLHRRDNYKISLWECIDAIWMFEDLDEWLWYTLPNEMISAPTKKF